MRRPQWACFEYGVHDVEKTTAVAAVHLHSKKITFQKTYTMNSWNLNESRHYRSKAQRDGIFVLASVHIMHAFVESSHQFISNNDNKSTPEAAPSMRQNDVRKKTTYLRNDAMTQSSCRIASFYSKKTYNNSAFIIARHFLKIQQNDQTLELSETTQHHGTKPSLGTCRSHWRRWSTAV